MSMSLAGHVATRSIVSIALVWISLRIGKSQQIVFEPLLSLSSNSQYPQKLIIIPLQINMERRQPSALERNLLFLGEPLFGFHVNLYESIPRWGLNSISGTQMAQMTMRNFSHLMVNVVFLLVVQWFHAFDQPHILDCPALLYGFHCPQATSPGGFLGYTAAFCATDQLSNRWLCIYAVGIP